MGSLTVEQFEGEYSRSSMLGGVFWGEYFGGQCYRSIILGGAFWEEVFQVSVSEKE